jgi:hypothetical protein
MKKTLLIIITALALLVSCKPKEVTGPAGAPGTNGTNGTNGKDGTDGTDGKDGKDGTNGKDGNANVNTTLYTLNPTDWVNIGNYKLYSNTPTGLTKAITLKGELLVSCNDSLNPRFGTVDWNILPFEDRNGVKYTYSYNQTGILIYAYNSNATTVWTPLMMNFKVSVIASN